MFKKYIFLITALILPLSSIAELRDPTLPGNLPQKQNPILTPSGDTPLNLTVILISNKTKQAIINGKTLTAGEILDDGTRILKIHPRYVLVRRNGVNKKLHLFPSVKQPLK